MFATGYAGQHGESLEGFTDERCVGMVRAAAGLPDVAVSLRPQIPGTDLKVLGFSVGARVARRYRDGRVFWSATRPRSCRRPAGWGSTGILDAHNRPGSPRSWSGRAGPALLDTYHAERHPVGLFTMQQALARVRRPHGAGDGGQGPAPLVDYQVIAFGYQYAPGRWWALPRRRAPPLLPDQLTGQPGPARRTWWSPWPTTAGSSRRSICTGGASSCSPARRRGVDRRRRRAVPESLGVLLDAYRFGVELRAPQTAADGAGAHGIALAGALLVRPDGFVAWRSTGAAADPTAELERGLQRLSRSR